MTNFFEKEEKKLLESMSPNEKINIAYNLLAVKKKAKIKRGCYLHCKILFDSYVEVIKHNDFGYDTINYKKLENAISGLSYREQVSILKYGLSIFNKELPEHKRDWFVQRINRFEFRAIFHERDIARIPKAVFIFASLNIFHLILIIALFLVGIYVILLPAYTESLVWFNFDKIKFSENFYLNHLYNTLCIFGDLSCKGELVPTNQYGLLLLLIGKVAFFIIIVNFIYRKLIDNISLK